MPDGTTIAAGRCSRRKPCAPRRHHARFLRRRSTIALLMALPLILLIGCIIVFPAFYAIWLSMLNKKMTKFVGLGNYWFLLKRDTFRMVIYQSLLFAGSAVCAKAILGFTLAHLMHNIPPGRQRIWRGLLLIPWVIPESLSTLGWWWLYRSVLFGAQLGAASVRHRADRLARQRALGALFTALVNTWYGTPFFMIMYLAALKSVPDQIYEAASIDGASAIQKLRFVTLPMMRNIIAITVLFSLIVTLGDFDIIRILTNGGPQNQTYIFPVYAFNVGIELGDIPLGASVSLFMLPVLAVAAFFVLRGVTRRTREIAG